MKIEPRSDFRQAAAGGADLVIAMLAAGFTAAQAAHAVSAVRTRGTA